MPQIELIVDEENTDVRLDVYLAENTPLSRTAIQKLIENGQLFLNGEVPNKKTKTQLNDHVSFCYEEKTLTDILPQDIPLNIVYEDEDLIVINKPKGIVVHPAVGNPDGTIVNALLYHCKELSDVNGYYRPGIVHRIDKDTSGLLVCAKNNETHSNLSEQLKDKTCFRKYYAIVSGVIENNEGEIDAPIGRSEKNRQNMCVTPKNSRPALTLFRVLERYDDSCLLDVELKTGRTHQIRVHMQYIGHPVVNDQRYGRKIIDESGQYLHAYYLSFIHPKTMERMEFQTDMPEYMKEYIKNKGGKA
ncbi:MAG: RluA family pseudouridine synthase [Erysipelotrichaceae bacterium]|jgi:23S rRNA pseudouridine1911/1915/1917 synthase|nr:RluA family pseudouridine synthase [Erysipelotrichaceae bacterium]